MDDETDHGLARSTSELNPGMVGGTYNAAIINNTSGNIIMTDCPTNVTFTTAPAEPSDFRRFPLGDIHLHELRLQNDSGVVDWRRRVRRSVRRVYSAKVEGRMSSAMVAMSQDEGAEEDWREDIAQYMAVRHPNIIQLCGAASSGNIHATIFYGDLIRLKHFQDLYRHSPMLIVYTYAYCYTEFGAARNYFESVFQHAVDEFECTLWVHRSTGRLCMDLVPGEEYWGAEVTISSPNRIESLDAANHEAMIINALTLDQYHRICYYELSQTREISISTSPMVNLGAVISSSSGTQLEDFLEIAFLPIAQRLADEPRWIIARGSDGDLMEDGWTRFTPTDAADNKIKLSLNTHDTEHWLSQANNVFSRLGISSNYEDYVVVTEIAFTVLISAATVDPPKGHLFLCPPKDLQTGASAFRWPDCPAYWSLDPSGVKHLSVEDPTKLSFPSIQFSMEIWGWFWDASVYTGLWQFHKAKGFDPDTQAIAQHLEESLYQLSSERDIPFAHIDGAESCDGDNHGPVTTATESEGSRKTSGGNHVASATLINHLEHASPPEETENSNTLQQVDARSSTSKDYLLDVKRIPLKRFAEQINTPQQAVIRASPQDDLTLRRLILDEKAQILEMYRLGIYTKEEVIAQLAQIETRCEVAAIRPPPAKRLRLSDSSGAGSFGDVETGDI